MHPTAGYSYDHERVLHALVRDGAVRVRERGEPKRYGHQNKYRKDQVEHIGRLAALFKQITNEENTK